MRTFFFPIDEYRPEHLDALTTRVREGLFDVEVHLHHEDDTADNLRRTLTDFARTLHEGHGFLAIARVQTERLRPTGWPAFLGRDFFLSGYRGQSVVTALDAAADLFTVELGRPVAWVFGSFSVRMPRSSSGMIASVMTSEWMPRSLRSARYFNASLVTRPRPICSVEPSSMMLEM